MMLNSAVILLTLFSCIDGAQKHMANVLSPLSQKVVANISHVIPGGVGFISLGKWRFGVTKDDHFSFSSGAKASIIFSSDGNIVVGGQDGHHFDKSVLLPTGSDVVVGDGFLQFGNWRIGQVNEGHMSLSHSGGKTAMIWRQDGTRHPGPRDDWNCWAKHLGGAANVYTGDGFVQTGVWRIGQANAGHMSIYSTKTKKTVVIYRSDATIHPGPRDDWQNTNAIINVALGTAVIPGGVGFISLGKWRFGVTKDDHFSFSSDAETSIIFSSDGNVQIFRSSHFDKSGLLPTGSDVVVGDGFLQFGNWRIGQVNERHMSLSHSGGKTAMIWRADGTRHPGPRDDWTCWAKDLGGAANVYTGDGFVQTGVWRIGQVNDAHMSIYSTKTKKTVVIYRSDGTIHPGPRDDWQNTNAILNVALGNTGDIIS